MAIQKKSVKITKTVPVAVTCDVCGRTYFFNDDDILYFKEVQGYGTLSYHADCGFGEKDFEKHFCSCDCLLILLKSCQYDCHLYFPRPIIEDMLKLNK